MESAGGIVIGRDGRVVLIEQHGNSWSFPKGTLEDGEDARAAAEREVREETGLSELEFIQDLGSYERYSIARNGIGETKEFGLKKRTFFLYRTTDTELKPLDHNEITGARWATIDEALSLLTHPKDREFLASVRSKIEA